jgi:hypothetical protein
MPMNKARAGREYRRARDIRGLMVVFPQFHRSLAARIVLRTISAAALAPYVMLKLDWLGTRRQTAWSTSSPMTTRRRSHCTRRPTIPNRAHDAELTSLPSAMSSPSCRREESAQKKRRRKAIETAKQTSRASMRPATELISWPKFVAVWPRARSCARSNIAPMKAKSTDVNRKMHSLAQPLDGAA